MRKRIIACIIILCSATCVFAGSKKKDTKDKIKQPAWLTKPASVYDENTYITGVGSGKNRSDAEKAAAAAIGSYLNQSIHAEEQVSKSFSNTSSGTESYLSNIKTQTSLKDLAGISIKENYTAPDGTEYALALLNRTESGQYYRNKVDENNKAISELLNQAENEEGSLQSCANARKAYLLSLDNEYYLSLLAVIKPLYKKTAEISTVSSNSVAKKVTDLLSKINILISVDGDTNGRIAGAFASSLSSLGIKTYGGTSGGEKVRYALLANVSYEPVTVNASNYYFCRYNIKVETIDKETGKNVIPWTKNARVGKLSEQEAKLAAIKALETVVTNEFANVVSNSLSK